MKLEEQYARALFEAKKPNVEKLKEVLKRRRHEKLLPQIWSEYQKLMLAAERKKKFTAVTPEREQRRILFEMYKKLAT